MIHMGKKCNFRRKQWNQLSDHLAFSSISRPQIRNIFYRKRQSEKRDTSGAPEPGGQTQQRRGRFPFWHLSLLISCVSATIFQLPIFGVLTSSILASLEKKRTHQNIFLMKRKAPLSIGKQDVTFPINRKLMRKPRRSYSARLK